MDVVQDMVLKVIGKYHNVDVVDVNFQIRA